MTLRARKNKIVRYPDYSGKYQLFFDFDNTITQFDILDDIIERFSVSGDWVKLEKEWQNGRIGSKRCLQGQLALVRITRKELSAYLKKVKIDPWFKRILALVSNYYVEPVIVSDDFDFIIKSVLRNHRIDGVKVVCNALRFRGDKLQLQFPHTDSDCGTCGHCKKKSLIKRLKRNKISIYIGDGRSDFCPAKLATVVFAKGSLLRHCRDAHKPYIPMKSLRDVYSFLKEKFDES